MLLSGSKGELARRNGEDIYINLNEPKYIREIIECLLNGIVSFKAQDKWVYNDGEELLRKLGYIFEYVASVVVNDESHR